MPPIPDSPSVDRVNTKRGNRKKVGGKDDRGDTHKSEEDSDRDDDQDTKEKSSTKNTKRKIGSKAQSTAKTSAAKKAKTTHETPATTKKSTTKATVAAAGKGGKKLVTAKQVDILQQYKDKAMAACRLGVEDNPEFYAAVKKEVDKCTTLSTDPSKLTKLSAQPAYVNLRRYLDKDKEDIPPECAEAVRLISTGQEFNKTLLKLMVARNWNPGRICDPRLSTRERMLAKSGKDSQASIMKRYKLSSDDIASHQASDQETKKGDPGVDDAGVDDEDDSEGEDEDEDSADDKKTEGSSDDEELDEDQEVDDDGDACGDKGRSDDRQSVDLSLAKDASKLMGAATDIVRSITSLNRTWMGRSPEIDEALREELKRTSGSLMEEVLTMTEDLKASLSPSKPSPQSTPQSRRPQKKESSSRLLGRRLKGVDADKKNHAQQNRLFNLPDAAHQPGVTGPSPHAVIDQLHRDGIFEQQAHGSQMQNFAPINSGLSGTPSTFNGPPQLGFPPNIAQTSLTPPARDRQGYSTPNMSSSGHGSQPLPPQQPMKQELFQPSPMAPNSSQFAYGSLHGPVYSTSPSGHNRGYQQQQNQQQRYPNQQPHSSQQGQQQFYQQQAYSQPRYDQQQQQPPFAGNQQGPPN